MSQSNKDEPRMGASPDRDKYGPELIGLLAELGAQEERTLLTDLSAWRAPDRLKPEDLLQAGSPWLSSLEKHILAVHRDELGLLLLDACVRKFMGSQRVGGAPFWNPLDREDPRVFEDEAAWRSELLRVRRLLLGTHELTDPLDLVDLLLSPGGDSRLSLLRIARAGFVVRPSETLSMYLAHGAEAMGDFEEAVRRFRGVYEEPCNYRNRLVAAGDLARLAEAEGRYAAATQWYEGAATGEELYSVFAGSWLFMSLRSCDGEAWKRASHEVAMRYPPSDPSFDSYCRQLRARRFAGAWDFSARAKKLVRSIDPGESEHVQKLHAVLL